MLGRPRRTPTHRPFYGGTDSPPPGPEKSHGFNAFGLARVTFSSLNPSAHTVAGPLRWWDVGPPKGGCGPAWEQMLGPGRSRRHVAHAPPPAVGSAPAEGRNSGVRGPGCGPSSARCFPADREATSLLLGGLGLSPWAPGPRSPESGPGARAPLGDTAASPMSLGGSARGSRLPQPRDRPSPGTRGSWAPAPSLLHRSEWTRPGGGSFSLSRAAGARGPVHPCCTEAGAGLRTRVAVRVRAASA